MRTLKTAITTQGTTASPSEVNVKLREQDPITTLLKNVDGPVFIRCRVCDEDGFADATNATIAAAGTTTAAETHSANKDLTFKTGATAQAAGILTVAGVVIDAETVTLGGRVYEFDTHATETVTDGNVAVDISGGATAAQGTLTVDTQPTAGDTMTVGDRTYAFVANGTAENSGEISVGADLAAAQVNIVAAINGTDSFNVANTTVSAADFATDDCVLTALAGGTAGNAIVTTETFTAATNIFDAGTLGTTTAGVDCIAATAITALVAAITGDASAVVTAADGAGDTVDVTYTEFGTAGNAIASTETMANGSFAAATLSGGANEANGQIDITVTNASAETVLLRFGPPAMDSKDTDWTETIEVTHAAP